MEDLQRYRDNALAECDDDPALRATLLAKQACNAAASLVAGIADAEAWALEAMALSRDVSAAVPRPVLYSMAWVRAMSGQPLDDLCEASDAASDPSAYIAPCAERVAGQRLVWRGEVSAARDTLQRYLELADERGELESYALMRLHLCELHLRVGDWDGAELLLDEWSQSADAAAMFRPKYQRCRALLAAGRGEASTLSLATQALERAEQTSCHWDGLEARRALAVVAALERRPAAAAAATREVWEHTEREGVTEPGVFPVAPELVEALVALGELAEAQTVTARLRELAEAQAHPWGTVTAERCAAVIDLGGAAYDDAAATRLLAAADRYEELGLRFDAARALLALGSAQRRFKQWGGARSALERAVAAFTAIGSHGWAAEAQSQLQRVGARRPRPSGELTETEQRTAMLAASGMSNKQIARELVVTVHTVEVHLSRAYAKLGISSRGQLAARMIA
jgi:DNA-binding NarL/FixJ family response regulator